MESGGENAVDAFFHSEGILLKSSLLPSFIRADALGENRWLCLNCHEDNHSFQHCRHSFINTSDFLNPELGPLGDDDA